MVENNPSHIARENKLSLISSRLSIALVALKTDFSTWLEEGSLEKRSQRELAKRYQVGFLPPWERLLLKGLINHPDRFSFVRRYLLADDLQEEGMRVLYALMEKVSLAQKGHLNANAIFEELKETPELETFFLNAILGDETPMSQLDLLQTTFTIYDALLQKKRLGLVQRIQQIEKQANLVSIAPLMGTLQFLNQRIEQFIHTRDLYFSQWEQAEK